MSGIAGIIAFDGSALDRAPVAAMTARLERRGPDGTHFWCAGGVALGHTLLATTPEALVERLPLTDPGSGCTIVADARIDNRADLLGALDLLGERRVIGDGELLLHAYARWGEDFPGKVLGDFAFAIWDPRAEKLLCARDPIGIRPLVYHQDRGRFVFASDPLAILAVPGLDAPLNPDRVADFLGNMEGADLESTMFRGIQRLPPAHLLTVDRDGMTMRPYWTLERPPLLRLKSDDDYAAAFREVFTQAVRCRLRSAGPVGAMLSGGIDSNAVAAVAGRLLADESRGPLATFSALGSDPSSCPESQAILAALGSPAFAPTTVSPSAPADIQAVLARQTMESAEPFDAHMVMVRAVYLAAQRSGINIVLDGIGGDLALASDFHIAMLLRRGAFRQAMTEARGERRFWGPDVPAWRALLAGAWQAFAPLPVRALRFRLGRRKADRSFLADTRASAPWLDVASALRRRRRVQRRDFGHDRLDARARLRPLLHPHLVVGRERYDRVASACGIEPRDPFLDLRVIRFCLSLPRDQLQRDGWPKWILRRAMTAVVPDAVAWRRGKEHVGHEFIATLRQSTPPARPNDMQAVDCPMLMTSSENLYLQDWFVYMLTLGWTPGSVTKEGSNDDDR